MSVAGKARPDGEERRGGSFNHSQSAFSASTLYALVGLAIFLLWTLVVVLATQGRWIAAGGVFLPWVLLLRVQQLLERQQQKERSVGAQLEALDSLSKRIRKSMPQPEAAPKLPKGKHPSVH